MAARLIDIAEQRLALARRLGCTPARWIVDEAVAADLPAGDSLHDIPLERGPTRFGLELRFAPRIR